MDWVDFNGIRTWYFGSKDVDWVFGCSAFLCGNGGSSPSPHAGAFTRLEFESMDLDLVPEVLTVLEDISETLDIAEEVDFIESRRSPCSEGRSEGRAVAGWVA